MKWLESYIWPAEHRWMDEEGVRCGARLGMAEMIRGGITTFCDMYFHEDVVAEVADEIGMRGIVGECFSDHPDQGLDLDETFDYMASMIARWKGHSRIVPAVAPHAPYTVSPPVLQRGHRMAVEHDVPFVIHVSETKGEVDDIRGRYGSSPIAHLDRVGVLDGRLIGAHCVWPEADEIPLLAARGCGVVHCPRSNLKLADGISPVPDLLAAGVRVGLGTDGAASNNQIDLFAEIDAAALIHKAVRQDPSVMKAAEILHMATLGGARALKLEELIGSLEVGKRADIVMIDLLDDHLLPLYSPLSHLAYAARGSDVRSVMIDGRMVLEERRLLTLDEGLVRRQVCALARKIAGAEDPRALLAPSG
jgi:5-methylthioadenosine/S-adenosylhomocysteine deaminase